MLGIKTFYSVLANVTFTTDIVLRTLGLTSPIAAGQRQKLKAWIPFSVGATGGIQVQIVVPAGGALFNASIKVVNTVAEAIVATPQAASAAAGFAVANAATHWLEIDAEIVNGATAGNVDIQACQNTSDALTLTVLRGGSLEVTVH